MALDVSQKRIRNPRGSRTRPSPRLRRAQARGPACTHPRMHEVRRRRLSRAGAARRRGNDSRSHSDRRPGAGCGGAHDRSTLQRSLGHRAPTLARRAGIDEDHLPYRTAITKCFPGKSPTGSGDRRPSPVEIALCTPWLDQELALLRPRVILLLGGLAIDRFWGKVSLEDAVGRARTKDGVTYIPLPHPSGASRWLNDPAHRVLLRRALGILRRCARPS